jgi:hypothetical protein
MKGEATQWLTIKEISSLKTTKRIWFQRKLAQAPSENGIRTMGHVLQENFMESGEKFNWHGKPLMPLSNLDRALAGLIVEPEEFATLQTPTDPNKTWNPFARANPPQTGLNTCMLPYLELSMREITSANAKDLMDGFRKIIVEATPFMTWGERPHPSVTEWDFGILDVLITIAITFWPSQRDDLSTRRVRTKSKRTPGLQHSGKSAAFTIRRFSKSSILRSACVMH